MTAGVTAVSGERGTKKTIGIRLLALLSLTTLLLAACAGPAPTQANRPPAGFDTTTQQAGASTAPLTETATSQPAVAATATQDRTSTSAAATAVTATTAPAQTTAVTAAPATSAPATQAAKGTIVQVTLSDMKITALPATVGSGLVTFTATNTGKALHELVVLRTNLAANAIPADPNSPGKVTEPGYLGIIPSILPGGSGSLSLTLDAGNYVLICNQPAHYMMGMYASFSVTASIGAIPRVDIASSMVGMGDVAYSAARVWPSFPRPATLREMSIDMPWQSAIAGPVTFSVTNTGTVTHELVVLKTDLDEANIPPDPNEVGRVSEDASVGESGDVAPGATVTFTLDLSAGHYVLICNEPGHYAAGMHTTFWVATRVDVDLVEMQLLVTPVTVPAGPVLFAVHNAGTVVHEMIIIKTDTAFDQLPADPDEVGMVSEDGAIDEAGDMDPGRWSSVWLYLTPGNYVLICNEPGHYAAAMRLAFTVE